MAEAVRYRNANFFTRDDNFGFFYTCKSPDLFEFELRHLFSGKYVLCRAQSCFHHAAGRAKYSSRSRIGAEKTVCAFRRKITKIDSRLPDHARKFARREHHVHVFETRRKHFMVARDLVFFSGTRHDRNHLHARRIDFHFLRIIGLRQHPHDLLRRFGRREVRYKVAVQLLHVVGPRWAARGN